LFPKWVVCFLCYLAQNWKRWARGRRSWRAGRPTARRRAGSLRGCAALWAARASGGSVRAAVETLRAAPHLDLGVVEGMREHLWAAQAACLGEYLREGVPVAVGAGPSKRRGRPVPPHPSALGHERELWESFWEDVLRGACLLSDTEADRDVLGAVEDSPLGQVPKFDALGREKPKGRQSTTCQRGGRRASTPGPTRTPTPPYAVMLPTLAMVATMALR
jgi:hypothetical protein